MLSKQLVNVKVNQNQPFLKPGQIVQGKIVKLYPNNKAQIQIGSQKMIAQLEACLTIGENYYFQVKSNADVAHLQVVGERMKDNVVENMRQLLQGLGIKATKPTIALMRQLMENKILFDKEQLMKAFQLVAGASDKGQAQLVIKEMFVYKLPLTESIYQSLYAKATSGFSDQLNGLLQQLKQDTNETPLKQSLIERLASLIDHQNSANEAISKHILSEVESNQKSIFIMAKLAGLVKNNVDYLSWKTKWQSFQNNGPTALLPFQLDTSKLLKTLEQTAIKKDSIIEQSTKIDQQFSPIINKANIHQIPLSSSDFTKLKAQIETKLLPLMTDKQQQQIKVLLQNNSDSLEHLQTILKTFANEQTYARIEGLVKGAGNGKNPLMAIPHEIFLAQVGQVLQTTGLSHEYNLANDLPEQQSTTIKSMVIQLLQQSDGVTNDRAQQLLHFITGMQIHSVNDATNVLQASIQIPGEKLALNKDLQLEFEGKKTESGKIDPAYCRILFYLDLFNLKETIVDMNIQKRSVAITVFNDNPAMLDHSHKLKPVLSEGLKALKYNLSTISVKPLKQIDVNKGSSLTKTENNSYQGVDYRI